MSQLDQPQSFLADIARGIAMFRQLAQQIEAVRQDFMMGGNSASAQLPSEVTQFHLRREMIALERQIRQALTNAFGKDSTQFFEFKFASATPAGLEKGLAVLEGFIFDLEQKRLHLLGNTTPAQQPAIDPTTDLYTEQIFKRYVGHEIAWSQRHGGSFGLLLLRLHMGHVGDARPAGRDDQDILVTMGWVLETSVRACDVPGRLQKGDFAVLLREANELDVNAALNRIVSNLRLATAATIGRNKVHLEYASTLYPFDAESMDSLFINAQDRWIRVPDESYDQENAVKCAVDGA
jgi:GGDEF domain-containing protein